MLRQQERLALELIFRGDSKLDLEIRDRIINARSTDWEETGVGFYSTVLLETPLECVPDIRMKEYNFSHPQFPHGGSYMCYIESINQLDLEAVTLGGANWPYPADSSQFSDFS